MRKYISFILCFTLVFIVSVCRCTVTYADTIETHSTELKGEVVGQYREKVYNVDIVWGKMNFIYKTVGTRTWNEKTHLFDEDTTSSWIAQGNDISVTNHSNANVIVNFDYKSLKAYSGVKGSFGNNTFLHLASAEGKALDDKTLVGKKRLTLNGKLSDTKDRYVTIGSINVRID